jgi:hypothetical protein
MKNIFIFLFLLIPLNFAVAKPTIKIDLEKIEIEDGKHIMTLKLTDAEDGSAIRPDHLKTVHTEKIHLLIIDDSLEDYSHIHPTTTDVAGEYEFEWMPKKMAKYKIWADLHPIKTDKQEFVITELKNKLAKKGKINRKIEREIATQDLDFKINFSKKVIKVGEDIIININVKDKEGNPFDGLESVMGAYAHLVAFHEDFKTIAHIHPMGEEPQWFWQSGGPDLNFHFSPGKKGFYKFFLQIKIDGEERFIPFGAVVK